MVKIEAIIRPSRLHEVKAALAGLGMGRMTVTDVRGVGHQRGRSLKGRRRDKVLASPRSGLKPAQVRQLDAHPLS